MGASGPERRFILGGKFWWDGQQWRMVSEDRTSWWDGDTWRPLPETADRQEHVPQAPGPTLSQPWWTTAPNLAGGSGGMGGAPRPQLGQPLRRRRWMRGGRPRERIPSPPTGLIAGIGDGGPGLKRSVAIGVLFVVFIAIAIFNATRGTPSAQTSHPAARGASAAPARTPESFAQASVQPSAAPSTEPTLPPAAASPSPSPFRLVPSPVRAAATFGGLQGGCPGLPNAFSDQFTFSVSAGVLTLRQLSTGDLDTGPIDPDGGFTVSSSAARETYQGRINGLTAGAGYQQRTRSGCVASYQVSFRFLV